VTPGGQVGGEQGIGTAARVGGQQTRAVFAEDHVPAPFAAAAGVDDEANTRMTVRHVERGGVITVEDARQEIGRHLPRASP
jgi:hypothetical protein